MIKKFLLTLGVVSVTTVFGMSLSQLNSASKADLMKINGIGEAKAEAIIKERAKGKFKSFEDLQRVKGVGPQMASNIKNDIKVGDKVKKVKTSAKKGVKSKTKKVVDTKKSKLKKVDNAKTKIKNKVKSTKKYTKDLKKKVKTSTPKLKH